jgi:type I restriction enzyme M protein
MLGAIYGDIAGSVYEFRNLKSKDAPLFIKGSRFTDDTVMTIAVADALMQTKDAAAHLDDFKNNLIASMHRHGKAHIRAGYGSRFLDWIFYGCTESYYSYGNGSAMRVSPVAWYAKTPEEAILLAKASAEVTHDHPEGIKGAEAVTAAIWLARQGESREAIRRHIEEHYYPLDFTLDDIRPGYRFDVSCQGSVPQAIEAFLESEDFEDAVRNAISLGGDSDTIGAMAGSIAEAFYGIPRTLRDKALEYLPAELNAVVKEFEASYSANILE